MTISDMFEATERGNTLLISAEGHILAWVDIDGVQNENKRLEISFVADNYPALNVRVVTLTDDQLRDHINEKLVGWFVRKCNIPGVNVDHSGYVEEFSCTLV